MIYLKICLGAFALIVFLRSVFLLFTTLIHKKSVRIIILKIFPVMEVLLWLAFAIWALHQLFMESTLYPLITGSFIIVLILIFAWYLFRDFIAGIILKAENAFEPGQEIITTLASGRIKGLGYRSMEIETNNGETIKIPYSLLSNQKLVKPSELNKGLDHSIILQVPSKYSAEETQNMLVTGILEMPWILAGEDIDVKIDREGSDYYRVEVHFRTLSHDLAIKTEDNLKVFVKEAFPG